MKPINIDGKLHQKVKMLSVEKGCQMYDIMNRGVEIILWYHSLNDEGKKAIDDEVEKFLIDKE